MRKAKHTATINTLIIPTDGKFLLGRNGLIQLVDEKASQFRLEGQLTKDRLVLSKLSFPDDDVVVDGERRVFWLPHPFAYESFFVAHRQYLREGVDYVRYESVGLYCVRTSPKGRLFEAAVAKARELVAAEMGESRAAA